MTARKRRPKKHTAEWIDVGSDVFVSLHTCSHSDEPTGALVRFGGPPDLDHSASYDHDEICVGGISWCPECKGPTWTLHSLDPLHVEPSIRTTCNNHAEHHGFIRAGRWENA